MKRIQIGVNIATVYNNLVRTYRAPLPFPNGPITEFASILDCFVNTVCSAS